MTDSRPQLDGPYGQKLYQIPHNKKADFLSNRLTYMDNQLSYLSEAISERPQDETTKQTMNTINERARNIQDLRTRIEDALRTNMNDQVILLSMVESDMEARSLHCCQQLRILTPHNRSSLKKSGLTPRLWSMPRYRVTTLPDKCNRIKSSRTSRYVLFPFL